MQIIKPNRNKLRKKILPKIEFEVMHMYYKECDC